SAAELSKAEFFSQYAGAAACNSGNAPGQAVTCSNNACPAVQADKATTVASFTALLTDVRGYVAIDPAASLIVASFRGSSSVRNWITNFVFTQIPCDLTAGCLIHTGFATGWAEVSANVTKAVAAAKAANPSYQLVVTGYSLGGAIATLAAAYLRKGGYAADLYTFGCPRVGNDVFAAYVTGQAGAEYRVTHTDDPVPRLPPIIFNYRHTSPEYWLTDDAEMPTVAEVEVCPGYANTSCNAGTTGLDTDAHGQYFGQISACSSGGTAFRKRDPADMSDAELEQLLNMWVAQDVAFVENGTATAAV
ncbi:putative triacylglycerol lipase precursor, partial [Bombardia bombarda]